MLIEEFRPNTSRLIQPPVYPVEFPPLPDQAQPKLGLSAFETVHLNARLFVFLNITVEFLLKIPAKAGKFV